MNVHRPSPRSTAVDSIRSVEAFIVSIPRDVPYLGPLREGERINEKGYVVRKGNRSIYPTTDMSVIVKVTGESGKVGLGRNLRHRRAAGGQGDHRRTARPGDRSDAIQATPAVHPRGPLRPHARARLFWRLLCRRTRRRRYRRMGLVRQMPRPAALDAPRRAPA